MRAPASSGGVGYHQKTVRVRPPNAVKNEALVPPLDQLFRELGPYVWRVMRRMGMSEAEADDLCQEVFLTAHRKRHEFEGRSTIKTWLYGIAIRVASDHRRRAHVRREDLMAELPELNAAGAADQAEMLDQLRARHLLDQVLASLDEVRRVTFVLYEVEDLPLRRIAEIMEVPLQTVYSRLKSARKHVEEAFQRALAPERPHRVVGGGAQ